MRRTIRYFDKHDVYSRKGEGDAERAPRKDQKRITQQRHIAGKMTKQQEANVASLRIHLEDDALASSSRRHAGRETNQQRRFDKAARRVEKKLFEQSFKQATSTRKAKTGKSLHFNALLI